MTEALCLACWTHYGAAMTLFGSSLFPLYAGTQTLGHHTLLSRASVLALVSGGLWLALAAATMGDGIADAVNPAVLVAVLTRTGFGQVWQYHLALALALVVVNTLPWPRVRPPGLSLALSALLLEGLAWTGHTVMASGAIGVVHIANQTVHLFAAAVWLGGLIPLGRVLWLARHDDTSARTESAALALRRFSTVALAAVVGLTASGLVNGWVLVGGFAALTDSLYGQVLMVKLLLFLALLVLAARNRLLLMPRLAAGSHPTLTALWRAVIAEQALGAMALGVAAFLGSLAPAINGP